jgi:hypothetical protein
MSVSRPAKAANDPESSPDTGTPSPPFAHFYLTSSRDHDIHNAVTCNYWLSAPSKA